jgi:hypothetical protein
MEVAGCLKALPHASHFVAALSLNSPEDESAVVDSATTIGFGRHDFAWNCLLVCGGEERGERKSDVIQSRELFCCGSC